MKWPILFYSVPDVREGETRWKSQLPVEAMLSGPTVRLCWKDGSPENMEPHKKLAGAVILAALWDAQNGNQKAKRWLQEDGHLFRFW